MLVVIGVLLRAIVLACGGHRAVALASAVGREREDRQHDRGRPSLRDHLRPAVGSRAQTLFAIAEFHE